MRRESCPLTALVLGVVFLAPGVFVLARGDQAEAEAEAAAPLRVGFYNGKCEGNVDVEEVVRSVVTQSFLQDPTITPALLRLQFHDCFVNGCDASILLDGNSTEKTAESNLRIRGYEVIDRAKATVEEVCPGVVSCADIIAMATRDAFSMSGREEYSVETGRRDGIVSLAKLVKVPSPSISVADSIKEFSMKGLGVLDMVYLLGGHTVGVAHCSHFKDRLYNFKNTGKPDPTMDESLLTFLRIRCPQNSSFDNIVNLDQNPMSTLMVDNSYYRQISIRRGVLQIDQDLALDPLTQESVNDIANGFDFGKKFGDAMVKLGRIEVLTGNNGEIRKSCRAVNHN